jgi:hypothetical protein
MLIEAWPAEIDEAGAALAAELTDELELLLPHPATISATRRTAAVPPTRNFVCVRLNILCRSYVFVCTAVRAATHL